MLFKLIVVFKQVVKNKLDTYRLKAMFQINVTFLITFSKDKNM